MFYRVVMQGRTVGGADLSVVKREFVRVTGLPVGVADEMFGGMPKVIKRKVQQSDAERIAATLRAIGAVATIERETGAVADEDDGDEGIEIIAAPASGPPTVAPGMAPADAAPAPKRRNRLGEMREKLPTVLGAILVVGAVAYFEPELSELIMNLRPVAAPAPPAPAVARAAAAAPEADGPVELHASFLDGPWRCVDQRTGLGLYWSYDAGGKLTYHGDVLSDRPAAQADAPTAWQLTDAKLLHKRAQGDFDTFKVTQLTLSRLSYVGEKGLEIECRRP